MSITGIQHMTNDPFKNAPMKPRDFGAHTMAGAPLETFSREDAVRIQYFRQYDMTDLHVTMEDIQNGYDTTKLKLPSLKPEDIAAYGQKLATEGLGKDINWNGVKADFKYVNDDISFADTFDIQVDYLSSRYAVLKERIAKDYSGDEQQKQLDTLNAIYSDTKQKMADAYVKSVGGFLEENGVTGEAEKLRQSMLRGIESRTQQYETALVEKPDYAGTFESQDAWLARDDGYMAMRLRQSVKETVNTQPTATVGSGDAYYTLRDLQLAGVYAKQTAEQYDSLRYAGTVRNEESIGLDLAMQAMKTAYLGQNSGMSKQMASVLNNAFNGYQSRYLDRLDENLQDDARNPASPEEYVPLDRQAVDAVFSFTMNRYQSTGDILFALSDGAAYGKQIYTQKAQSESYAALTRYQEKPLYSWDNFFKAPTQAHYKLHKSDFEKYAAGFYAFAQSVGSGNISDVNLMLGKNGNSAADAVTVRNYDAFAQMGYFSAMA